MNTQFLQGPIRHGDDVVYTGRLAADTEPLQVRRVLRIALHVIGPLLLA